MNGYLIGAPRQRQAVLLNIEFTGEVISTVVDAWRGGGALSSVFPPSRQLRAAVSGSNDLFRVEIYDRTDLLEPLVRVNYQDFSHCPATSVHLQGENFIGWLNAADLGINSTCDFTFDNYHATAARSTPVGFPGTPQVVELTPRPQTLFYSIPATNPITFAVQTFTANQINTNSVKLFLNDLDVSAQLVFSNRAGILDPPNANFGVRYTGTLTPNTVYRLAIYGVTDDAGNALYHCCTYFTTGP